MTKKYFFLLSEFILLLAIAIITLFSYLNSQTNYRDYITISKKISTDELKYILELSLSFSKTYTQDTNFSSLLKTNIAPISENINLQAIVFADKNEKVLYQEKIVQIEDNILELNFKTLPTDFTINKQNRNIIEYNNFFWLETKLFNKEINSNKESRDNYVGSYFTAYLPDDFRIDFFSYLKTYAKSITSILLLGTLALLCFSSSLSLKNTKEKREDIFNKRNKSFLFIITTTYQIALSAILLYGTYNFYLDATYMNLTNLVSVESKQIERLLNLGLPIETYASGNEHYTEKLSQYNTIQNFTIFDAHKEKVLEIKLSDERRKEKALVFELLSEDGKTLGSVKATLSAKEANYYTFISSITFITIFIISFLAATEGILFFTLPKIQKNDDLGNLKDPLLPVKYIRIAISIFTYSTSLAISFIPLKMFELMGQSKLDINPIFASGLPSSAEFASCLIALLFVNKVSDKYGWQSSFILGCALYAIASLVSAFASSPQVFIFSRALCGFAYAFAWLSPQAFTLSLVPPEKRALSFALTTAGIYSGYIAGVSSGAILSVESSYAFTFMLSALLSILAIIILIFTMKAFFIKPIMQREIVEYKEEKNISLMKYLCHKDIFAATFFVLIPFSLIQIGFLNFAIPITFKELGFTPVLIGASIMFYGLVQVYISPILTQYFQKIKNKRLILFIGYCITFFALYITNFSPYILFISVIFLGIAGVFIGPSQSAFVANSPITQEIGITKSIGIQRFSDKLGQALGPFLYAILFTAFPYNISLTISAWIFLLCGILFIFFTRK